MQYLRDDKGRRYLDATAGIVTVSVAYCPPRIVEPRRDRLGKLFHTTTIYLQAAVTARASVL